MHDTTGHPDHTYTRRIFLQRGVTLASLASTAPLFLERSAGAMMAPLGSMLSSQPGVPEDHVLVVVQLGGGNDGLNTVVPYGSGAYYDARPSIAIPAPGRRTAGNAAAATSTTPAAARRSPRARSRSAAPPRSPCTARSRSR